MSDAKLLHAANALDAVKTATRADLAQRSTLQGRAGSVDASLSVYSAVSNENVAPAAVVPTGLIPWPEALHALRAGAQASSAVGFCEELDAVWVSVDDTVHLWHIESDTVVSLRTANIAATAVFVYPAPKEMIPATTTHVVLLLGETGVGVRQLTCTTAAGGKFRITPVGTAMELSTETRLITLCQVRSSKRIFAGAADGHLRELLLPTAYSVDADGAPSLSMVNHGILFSTTPGLHLVGEWVSGVRRVLTGKSPAPIIDLCTDASRDVLFTLGGDGSLAMWTVPTDGSGLQRSCELAYTMESLKSMLHSAVPATLPRLKRIRVVSRNRTSGKLVALAENGDRIVYSTLQQSWALSGGTSLVATEYVKSLEGPGLFVSHGLLGDELVVTCPDPTCVTFTYIPVVSLPVPTVLEHTLTFRVGRPALDLMERQDTTFGSKFTAETPAGSWHRRTKEVLVAADDGIHVFARLATIDVLHALLGAGNEHGARAVEQCLPTAEWATCLLGLASGHELSAPFSRLATSSAAEQTDASRSVWSSVSSSSVAVRRAAVLLLRRCAEASLVEGGGGNGAAGRGSTGAGLGMHGAPTAAPSRRPVVSLSPFAVACAQGVGRSLAPIWNERLFASKKNTMELSNTVIDAVATALERTSSVMSDVCNELWVRTPPEAAAGWQFDARTATLVEGAPLTSRTIVDAQNVRVTGLLHVAVVARQVMEFLRFLNDVSPSIISRTCRADREVSAMAVKDLVERPHKAAGYARHLLQVVVQTERGRGGVPNYDCLLQLFDAMERKCDALFTSADSMGHHAAVEIDHLREIQDTKRRATAASRVVASLVDQAKGLFETGAMDGLVRQLLELESYAPAVHLLSAAAAQMDSAEAATALQNGTSSKALDAKRNVVGRVAEVLEAAWRVDPRLLADLLAPTSPLWQEDPTDKATHWLLFQWLVAPRKDGNVRWLLRRAMAQCGSPWLEQFLVSSSAASTASPSSSSSPGEDLAMERAVFYRYVKGDAREAVKNYMAVATGSLSDLPPSERLAARLECLREASACAVEAGVDKNQLLSMQRHIEIQQRLANVVKAFLEGNSSTLGHGIGEDAQGNTVSQGHVARQHVDRLWSSLLDADELFAIAACYRGIGGASAQLQLFHLHGVVDRELYAAVVLEALNTASDLRRMVVDLARDYDAVSFPLPAVIARLLQEEAKEPGVVRPHELLIVDANFPPAAVLDGLTGIAQHSNGRPSSASAVPGVDDVPPRTAVNALVNALSFVAKSPQSAVSKAQIRACATIARSLSTDSSERLEKLRSVDMELERKTDMSARF